LPGTAAFKVERIDLGFNNVLSIVQALAGECAGSEGTIIPR
jgi:hypothetical protein